MSSFVSPRTSPALVAPQDRVHAVGRGGFVAPRAVRLLFALLGLVLAALGLAATGARAQKCTLGWDTPRSVDRPPSACQHLAVGGRVAAPLALGPGRGVWLAVHAGGGWKLAVRAGAGITLGPALPVGSTPSGMARGADGALYVAARRVLVRFSGAGAPRATRLVAPAVSWTTHARLPFSQLAAAAGAVWVPVRAGLLRVGANGAQTLYRTPRRPRGGLARGADGGLWFSAGGRLGRLDPASGAVSMFDVSPPADGAVSAAPRGSNGIWYASRARSAVANRTFSGHVDSFGLIGAPVSLAPGPGRNAVWVSGGSRRRPWLARVATAGHPGGRPAGIPCEIQDPIACGVNLSPGRRGDADYFNARAVPGGLTAGADGDIHFSEHTYLGRVLSFRGVLPCVHIQPSIGRFRASSCRDGQWSSFVTRRPVAYPRVSCLQLIFDYCAGSIRLYFHRQRLGRGTFVLQGYDNPDARVPITQAGYRLIKTHGHLYATAVIDSFDFGGLHRRSTRSIVLYPGDHQIDR
jgi:hypothetical protein